MILRSGFKLVRSKLNFVLPKFFEKIFDVFVKKRHFVKC
jgi:hypothetical protein